MSRRAQERPIYDGRVMSASRSKATKSLHYDNRRLWAINSE